MAETAHQSRPIAEFFRYRDLLAAWTLRTVRARYQQSILGGLWAVIQPAAYVAVLSVIFTRFIPIDTGGIPYVVFSYSAMVPWTFLSTSLNDMVTSLVDNLNLVTKIYFPKEILPLAMLLARLLDFLIASLVLVLLMSIFDIPIFQGVWVFLPLVLLVQALLMAGLGLLGSALNVFFRDIKHVFSLGLQVWIYATPIIYPVSMIPERFRSLYFLNPMAGVIEAYRSILLEGTAPEGTLLQAAAVSLVLFVAGLIFFKKVEIQFADVV